MGSRWRGHAGGQYSGPPRGASPFAGMLHPPSPGLHVLVNNKAEGSAPLTIRALAERLASGPVQG